MELPLNALPAELLATFESIDVDQPTPTVLSSPSHSDALQADTNRRTPQSVADELLEVVEQVSESEHASLMPTGHCKLVVCGTSVAQQVEEASMIIWKSQEIMADAFAVYPTPTLTLQLHALFYHYHGPQSPSSPSHRYFAIQSSKPTWTPSVASTPAKHIEPLPCTMLFRYTHTALRMSSNMPLPIRA